MRSAKKKIALKSTWLEAEKEYVEKGDAVVRCSPPSHGSHPALATCNHTQNTPRPPPSSLSLLSSPCWLDATVSQNVSITQFHFSQGTPCWVVVTTCKGEVSKYKYRNKYNWKSKDAPVSHDIPWCASSPAARGSGEAKLSSRGLGFFFFGRATPTRSPTIPLARQE